jgi:hypothetical protein
MVEAMGFPGKAVTLARLDEMKLRLLATTAGGER